MKIKLIYLQIFEISNGVLETKDIVKEVIAQLLPDLELVTKKNRDLKPEATYVLRTRTNELQRYL